MPVNPAPSMTAAAAAHAHFTIAIRLEGVETDRSLSIAWACSKALGLRRATERSDITTHTTAVARPASAPVTSDNHVGCRASRVVPTAPTHQVRSP